MPHRHEVAGREPEQRVRTLPALLRPAVEEHARIERHVADNADESKAKKTLEIIRAAGEPGISKTELIRKTHFLGRDRDGILKSLVESEEVVATIRPGTTKPTTVYRAVG